MGEGQMFTFSHLQLSGMRSIHSTQKDFIDSKPNFPGLYLSKYNLIVDEEAKRLGIEVNEK